MAGECGDPGHVEAAGVEQRQHGHAEFVGRREQLGSGGRAR